MLVDHLIDFKGCSHHPQVIGEHVTGLKEFIDNRIALLEQIPEFADPDFAQSHRLPESAQALDDSDDAVEDEWRKFDREPLSHMTIDEWKNCHDIISEIFTGEDNGDDEDMVQFNRYLEVGKGDAMFANSRAKRELAQGEVTLDIDSTLALFTDLSLIKTVIKISIVANPMRNLKTSVHLLHNSIPLHWIPHYHLGCFGHDPNFDLFIFLPALYNKAIKRRKNNLRNHVPEHLREQFMDKCLLPAIKEVVTPNESQSWVFNYAAAKAKSLAVGLEGTIYKSQKDRLTQQVTFDLDADYIAAVWNICHHRLRRDIRRDG